jgi:flagellar motility protein MotE (MotC chaperone)
MRTAGARGQEPGITKKRSAVGRKLLMTGLLPVLLCLTVAFSAFAQDDMLKLIEAKRVELREKEDALKHEEQRLNALRKDVDAKIETYTRLLTKAEAAVKKIEEVKGERIEGVVKAYEVMPAEDAAARLSVLDDDIALQIMTRMKSKKAGAIIAVMEPRKAAALTKRMTTLSSKSRK